MDQNKPEPTLEESIKQVMQTLPPAIRDYLSQGRYTAVAKSLMAKYALRIDQGGVLERELMLLLMGIENPDEFTKALAEEASLNQQTVSGIVQDINTQIFIPLREEMRKGPTVATKPTAPAAPADKGLISTDATQPPHFFHLENKLPPNPVSPVMQPSVTPRPAVVATPSTLAQAIGNALGTQPKAVQPPRPSSNIAPLPPKFMSPKSFGSQTSPKPSTLLEDHEEPHIELNKAPMPAKVAEETVRPPAPISPIQPRTVPPPPNLPGAMPPVSIPDMPSAPEVTEVHTLPIVPKVEPPMPPRLAAVMPAMPPQSYTVDPYREPIE